MDNEQHIDVWVNLNKLVDNDPKRSDVLEYRGQFYRVLSLKQPDDESFAAGWTLVRAIRREVKGRQAPLFVMIGKVTQLR